MIALLTLLSRIFGLARWLAQSTWVGAQAVANGYASANQLPNVIFEVAAGGALAGVTVPLLALPVSRHLKKDVNRLSSALLTWTLVILIPLAVILWALSGHIASWMPDTVGSDVEAQNQLMAWFLSIFAWQLPLYGISIVLTGILQAHKKFFWPAIAPLLSSSVVIVAYAGYGYLSQGIDDPNTVSRYALLVLAWGTTGGVMAMSLPLFIPVWRLGIRLRPRFTMQKTELRRALSLAGAGIGALIAQQVSVLTNLTLARSGGELGTVAVYQYTQAVYVLPYAVLAVPVATAVFPRLTELAAQKNMGGFARVTAASTRSVIAVTLLGTAALIALGPAAEAVFSWRNPVEGMSTALVWLAPSLVGYALLFHISRVLYAVDAGHLAVICSMLGWLCTAVVSIVAVKVLSPHGANGPATLQGLGIGQSVGMTVAAIALLLAVYKKIGKNALRGIVRTVVTCTLASVVAGLLGRLSYDSILDATNTTMLMVLLAACICGILVVVIVVLAIWLGLRDLVPVSLPRRARTQASVPPSLGTVTSERDEP